MNTDTFYKHWGVAENPFKAEEARDDPILAKLMSANINHPEFEKIFGDPSRPHAAVVFGEKGSGKTALRLMMEDRIRKYNTKHPSAKVWIVKYDDFNPLLDRYINNLKRLKIRDGLRAFRLEDHQDGILSGIITKLVDQLTDETEDELKNHKMLRRKLRWMSRQKRLDLAELCILYDQPVSGSPEARWAKVRSILRMGRMGLLKPALVLGLGMVASSLVILFLKSLNSQGDWRTYTAVALTSVSGIFLLLTWAYQSLRLRGLAKQIRKEVHVVERTGSQLRNMLSRINPGLLEGQPVPVQGNPDARYQLMSRLIEILAQIDYHGVMVLLDRMDEPTLVKGHPEKMRSIIWPMLDNKFLQQEGLGIKLLLPIELRHLLKKEDGDFYQKARLDKQHMIDALIWSGATLYDLCNIRLAACSQDQEKPTTLDRMFDENVREQDIIDALGQMEQPRDAFKFIYAVILEHCRTNSDQDPAWTIPKLTLDYVRREQSQRIQELHRGLTPA